MALSVEASEKVVSKGIDHWNLKSEKDSKERIRVTVQ
jgi:hypothetical protein